MWPNPQETADLVTFTEEILNGKLHFLCSAVGYALIHKNWELHPLTQTKFRRTKCIRRTRYSENMDLVVSSSIYFEHSLIKATNKQKSTHKSASNKWLVRSFLHISVTFHFYISSHSFIFPCEYKLALKKFTCYMY